MGKILPIMSDTTTDGKIRVNVNRRWATFLNDANDALKKGQTDVTLRALGTAVNSLFTIANVFEREKLGKIVNISTFHLKDEDEKSNPKLGCEITLQKASDFEVRLEAYHKSIDDAREQR